MLWYYTEGWDNKEITRERERFVAHKYFVVWWKMRVQTCKQPHKGKQNYVLTLMNIVEVVRPHSSSLWRTNDKFVAKSMDSIDSAAVEERRSYREGHLSECSLRKRTAQFTLVRCRWRKESNERFILGIKRVIRWVPKFCEILPAFTTRTIISFSAWG